MIRPKKLLITLGTCLLCSVAGVPHAAGGALPLSPKTAQGMEVWTNTAARAGEAQSPLSITIKDAGRAVLKKGESTPVLVEVTNSSDHPINNITLAARYAAAVDSVSSARTAMVADVGTFSALLNQIDLPELQPGERTEQSLKIPTTDLDAGTYPLAIAVTEGSTGATQTQRMLLTVQGVQDIDESVPLSFIVPLTEETNILAGETGESPENPPLFLTNESLANELSDSGRLSTLLDVYRDRDPSLSEATCLALDPALVETVSRMANGYTASESRAELISPNTRLRDSWGKHRNSHSGQEGAGAADARKWLDELRQVAAHSCVFTMPWANTDLNAVAQSDNEWLMREATHADQVIQDILGVTPLKNVLLPGSGYLSEETVAKLSPPIEGTLSDAWEQGTPTYTGETTSVLLADNTVWGTRSAGHFAELGPQVRGVIYDAALAATLATTGAQPATMGYSNPESRYRYSMDSEAARNAQAAGALELAIRDDPVLATLPAKVNADTLTTLFSTATDMFGRGAATAAPLSDYLSYSMNDQAELEQTQANPDGRKFGAPFIDPTSFSDVEILRANQQAGNADALTQMMVNDPNVSLTRYNYTAPLRRDLLTVFSLNGRLSLGSFDTTAEAAGRRLGANREVLQGLRASVSLIPPGNLYTRTSDNSPLLVVAENGLPLPVVASIDYSSDNAVTLHTPGELRIPARGSMTVQMTTDVAESSDRTAVTMWLARPNDKQRISDPVQVAVQTRSTWTGITWLVIATAAAFLFTLISRNITRRFHK